MGLAIGACKCTWKQIIKAFIIAIKQIVWFIKNIPRFLSIVLKYMISIFFFLVSGLWPLGILFYYMGTHEPHQASISVMVGLAILQFVWIVTFLKWIENYIKLEKNGSCDT